MRRVLSIFPDDREAHAGLSEVYRIEKRPDDAIWHLERAFEQTPNDQTILDNLREMYRKYHKTEHGKVQLTAAAVARQYIRNGLYDQAIDLLPTGADTVADCEPVYEEMPGWPDSTVELAATLPTISLLELEARVDSALLWALVAGVLVWLLWKG